MTTRAEGASVKGAIGVLVVSMFLSRLLGWIRLTSLSSLYGRNLTTDAFLAAFTVPDLVYMLASGGAMAAAFVPTLTYFWTNERRDEGWRVASTIINQSLVILLTLLFFGEIFARTAVMILPGFRGNAEALALASTFVRLLFPNIVFLALAALCNGVLHSFNHFLAPAVSWLAYNVSFIAAAILCAGNVGLQGVCVGVVIGTVLMVFVQVPELRRRGMKYSLAFDYGHPAVVEYWKMFFPVMIAMALTQINLMVMPTVFGSVVGQGAITALSYANRIMFIPLGMFGGSIAVALFPRMSRQAANGEYADMSRTMERGIRASVLFSLPCTALMMTCGLPATRIVLGYGKFGFADCAATANALTYFSLGLVGHSVCQVIARGFYARRDSMTPVVIGIATLLVTIPLAMVLIKTPLFEGGVALAISISTLLNLLWLFAAARRKLALELRGIATMSAKTLAASIAMGLAAAGGNSLVPLGPEQFALSRVVLRLGLSGGLACLVFVALMKLARVEEFDEMLGSVRSLLRRLIAA